MHKICIVLSIIALLCGCQSPVTYSNQAKKDIQEVVQDMHMKSTISKKQSTPMPSVVAHSLRRTSVKEHKANLFNISANSVPAKKFFYTLSKQTNTNMVVDDEVNGNITFDLKQVSLENILELLSSVHDLYFRRVSGTIYVMPRRLETKIYTIQGLALKRRGSSSMTVSGGNETSDASSTSNATLTTDFDIQNIWKDIQLTITAIIDSDYRNNSQLQERDYSYGA